MKKTVSARYILALAIAAALLLGVIMPLQTAVAQGTGIDIPTMIPSGVPTGIPSIPDISMGDYWKIEVDIYVGPAELAAAGGVETYSQMIKSTLSAALPGKDIQVGVTSKRQADGSTKFTIIVEGYGVILLREVIHRGLTQIVDVFSLPISLTMQGSVGQGDKFNMELGVKPASGYGWGLDTFDTFSELLNSVECVEAAPGEEMTQFVNLEALKNGMLSLKMFYQRAWEKLQEARVRITIRFSDFPSSLNLAPLGASQADEIISTKPGLGPLQNNMMNSESLPATYHWETTDNRLGKAMVTDVRDQENCGSCWSFGTVGVLESAIMIQGGGSMEDMAEQYLVSCNQDDWGCDGGWWAHDYHINKQGAANNPAGGVYEYSYPYTASDSTCQYVSNHPYKLESWHYVGDDSLDQVDAIKSAIYNYGPVDTAVCASGWGSYTGGVYRENNCTSINHAVIITGWDDSTQSWTIKNSWGPDWGENGYMRIGWGVNGIGSYTNYVVYSGYSPGPSEPTKTPTQTNTPNPNEPTDTPVPPTSTPVPGGDDEDKTPTPTNTRPSGPAAPTHTSTPTEGPSMTPTPTETPRPSFTPPGLMPGILDDVDFQLSFSGNWLLFNGSGPINNTAHFSYQTGSSLTFEFTGTQFVIGYTAHPGKGVLLIRVDNQLVMVVNQYNETLLWGEQWESPVFAAGFHTVTIEHAKGEQVDIDYISILNE